MFKDKTFEEVSHDEMGTIYLSGQRKGIHYLVMRGPFSLVAYLGIAVDHPLANKGYTEIPLNVHGGLTFSGMGSYLPGDIYWYGWDYAHSYDGIFGIPSYNPEIIGHKWSTREVKDEVMAAIPRFANLIRAASK